MKTIDLSDLKSGDTAWSCVEGEGIIQETDSSEPWTIRCHNQWYQTNGISGVLDIHPTLFHNEQEFREYWCLGETLEVLESNTLTKREIKIIDKMVERAIDLITKLNETP